MRTPEETMRGLAAMLADAMPRGIGFALLIFDFGPDGSTAYASNGQRADVVKAVREWLRQIDPDGN